MTAALGAGWRLPAKAECEELAKLQMTFTHTDATPPGFTLTAPNGNSIFIEYSGGDNVLGAQSKFWTPDACME